jgi:hypothetical protein
LIRRQPCRLPVSRSAPAGTYPITITGKSGSAAQTTTLNLSFEKKETGASCARAQI